MSLNTAYQRLSIAIDTAFLNRRPQGPLTSEDQDGTQYQRICNMLGIEYIYAKTPEAKGRIERLNQTLQGRWPKEFKLRGIKDINTANLHIEEFVNEYNEEFAIKPFTKKMLMYRSWQQKRS